MIIFKQKNYVKNDKHIKAIHHFFKDFKIKIVKEYKSNLKSISMKKNLLFKKISFLLLFLIFLYFSISAFSQFPVNRKKNQYKPLTEKQKQEKRDSIVNNSDYIFYGFAAGELVLFTDDSKKDVYRVIRIYVRDVIRGPQELKNTYIYRISRAYGIEYNEEALYDKFQQIHHYYRPMYYTFVQKGYLFCKKNTMSLQYLTDSSYIHPDYLDFEYIYDYLGFDVENSFICETTSNIVHGISTDDINNIPPEGFYELNVANEKEVINYLLPYGNIITEK